MSDQLDQSEASELWHRHLFHDLTEYVALAIDTEGRVAELGRGAAALLGIEPDSDGGPRSLADYRSGGADLGVALEAAAARGGANAEVRYRRADGSTFVAAETITPIRSVEGGVIGYSVLLRDVTEERRRYDELSRSQATFEGILAIATDAVVCASAEQRIIFFNHGAEQIFGFAADEVLGQPLEILIPEPHRPNHAAEVRKFARSGVPARRMGERGEITGRRKSGEIFPAEAAISQLEVNGVLTFTAVLRDVSERRRAEEALAANTRELERSNAELEQFAYVASHDLQEPLRMVASYTQLLARRYQGKLDEDADEFIGYVVDGVNRMQALISDLLTYSRVGTRGGETTDLTIDDVLDRVLRTLGPAIVESGATVTHDPLPTVHGDAGQLTQLLQNLIGNAIKFHGDRPPRVHVAAEADGAWWRFSVRDEGIGIDPRFSERIFVIFQRLHSRGEYPGTGIGLSICRKIVERHGGSMWVESTPGAGATFYFTLPAAEGGPK